ncbi:hypothetical protein ACLSZY_10495, partial [Avibacterium volantium]|uniref:hypothetical protein n=1 Tax=Avibacterium volantium TaxID=762 RepID=UPI003BF8576D
IYGFASDSAPITVANISRMPAVKGETYAFTPDIARLDDGNLIFDDTEYAGKVTVTVPALDDLPLGEFEVDLQRVQKQEVQLQNYIHLYDPNVDGDTVYKRVSLSRGPSTLAFRQGQRWNEIYKLALAPEVIVIKVVGGAMSIYDETGALLTTETYSNAISKLPLKDTYLYRVDPPPERLVDVVSLPHNGGFGFKAPFAGDYQIRFNDDTSITITLEGGSQLPDVDYRQRVFVYNSQEYRLDNIVSIDGMLDRS